MATVRRKKSQREKRVDALANIFKRITWNEKQSAIHGIIKTTSCNRDEEGAQEENSMKPFGVEYAGFRFKQIPAPNFNRHR